MPRGLPRGGWGSDLGPLGSDQGLQATTAAGLNLPRAGVLIFAGSVDAPDLDALLGTTWEEMLRGRAACPAGPAQPHCSPGPEAGRRLGALRLDAPPPTPPVRSGARVLGTGVFSAGACTG